MGGGLQSQTPHMYAATESICQRQIWQKSGKKTKRMNHDQHPYKDNKQSNF